MDMTLKRNDKLISKKFFEFFFPSVLMAASASISLIVDSIIVGNILGEDALAAVNLLTPISLVFTAASAMFGIGAASFIAILKGKMDHENANKTFALSFTGWAALSMLAVFSDVFVNDFITGFSKSYSEVYSSESYQPAKV